MNKLPRFTALVLTVSLAAAALSGCGGQSATSGSSTAAAEAAARALTDPDGEYAAAASYQAVLAEFGQVEPYASIERQEQRHIAALTRQLQRLGAEVPADPWAGKVKAPADLETAAENWAEGEVKNVALYDELMAAAEGDPMLTRVFSHLRRASQEMHLPLFRQAAENGGTLEPGQSAHRH